MLVVPCMCQHTVFLLWGAAAPQTTLPSPELPLSSTLLLSCPAEHSYGADHLSFANLTGRDKDTLRLLAACPTLDAHLALITLEEVVHTGVGDGGFDQQHMQHL